MQAMWCRLSVLLAVVSSVAVMGESTSAKPGTTEPTSVVTTADVLGQSTGKTPETSSSTKPTSVATSVSVLQSTRTTLQTTDSTEQTSVVTSAKVLGQTTSETLELSHPTQPTSTGVIQNPSSTMSLPAPTTLYLTSARTEDMNGSPVQLTSTTNPPIQTTQGVSSSQQPTTDMIRLSTSTGIEEGTSTSQEPTVPDRSEQWTTADPASVSEVTSFSTPVTNISEVNGILGPGVKRKRQSPPTSTITSATKHSTTTAATSSKASGSKVTSAVPVVNDLTKVTTKNYNRLTTAQATTKKISLVTQCLIVIAILAGICTIFVICTIVLCTKLSTQRHNYRVNQMNGTELICISALLPEEERKMRKKLRPKRLRDLKETMTGQNSDTDDDDLTLQSFVTEH
ncbi:P-selectin glycoprotein ligand 1 [Mobula birostris]|uniref:P-selectin glycoprotein ligand 1 n=1 Tax=Mobula birostris TaxID=1983395 RepID=UPI003B28D340